MLKYLKGKLRSWTVPSSAGKDKHCAIAKSRFLSHGTNLQVRLTKRAAQGAARAAPP